MHTVQFLPHDVLYGRSIVRIISNASLWQLLNATNTSCTPKKTVKSRMLSVTRARLCFGWVRQPLNAAQQRRKKVKERRDGTFQHGGVVRCYGAELVRQKLLGTRAHPKTHTHTQYTQVHVKVWGCTWLLPVTKPWHSHMVNKPSFIWLSTSQSLTFYAVRTSTILCSGCWSSRPKMAATPLCALVPS